MCILHLSLLKPVMVRVVCPAVSFVADDLCGEGANTSTRAIPAEESTNRGIFFSTPTQVRNSACELLYTKSHGVFTPAWGARRDDVLKERVHARVWLTD